MGQWLRSSKLGQGGGWGVPDLGGGGHHRLRRRLPCCRWDTGTRSLNFVRWRIIFLFSLSLPLDGKSGEPEEKEEERSSSIASSSSSFFLMVFRIALSLLHSLRIVSFFWLHLAFITAKLRRMLLPSEGMLGKDWMGNVRSEGFRADLNCALQLLCYQCCCGRLADTRQTPQKHKQSRLLRTSGLEAGVN